MRSWNRSLTRGLLFAKVSPTRERSNGRRSLQWLTVWRTTFNSDLNKTVVAVAVIVSIGVVSLKHHLIWANASSKTSLIYIR
jgi:hypothetical protein